MSRSGTFRIALAGTVLAMATLATPPAHAGSAAPTYTGWVQREDGPTSGTNETYTLPGSDTLHLVAGIGNEVGV